jgi:adenylylsulfate kinase
MAVDIIYQFFRKDPTIKRHFIKAISWRLVGSVDTVILGALISGKWVIGVKIGTMELATKIMLYFIHERIWKRIPWGLSTEQLQHFGAKAIQSNLVTEKRSVTRTDWEQKNKHRSFTIWLTGLPASGKSTLANALESHFFSQQIAAFVLDGDNTRLGINKDLNFTASGRKENIRRVAEIAKLFNEAGTIVIASFISPFEADREAAKAIIGNSSFIEVYLNTSLQTCMQRDVKGNYKKAQKGIIKNFTGISSPYEVPMQPDIALDANNELPEALVHTIHEWLKGKGYLGEG